MIRNITKIYFRLLDITLIIVDNQKFCYECGTNLNINPINNTQDKTQYSKENDIDVDEITNDEDDSKENDK